VLVKLTQHGMEDVLGELDVESEVVDLVLAD
jgi:hypothetical protein